VRIVLEYVPLASSHDCRRRDEMSVALNSIRLWCFVVADVSNRLSAFISGIVVK
jgi:hypothetical protein